MRDRRPLRYGILWFLIFWFLLVLFSRIFPVILRNKVLFGGLVVLLLIGGVVTAALAAREMFRR